MLHQRLSVCLVISVLAAGAVGACGSSEDSTDIFGNPIPSGDAAGDSTLPPFGSDGSSTADANSVSNDASTSDTDGATPADADVGNDSAVPDEAGDDTGAPLADSGVVEDSGVVFDSGVPGVDSGVPIVDSGTPDWPDQPPVSFPSTTPLLFGYTLQDAYPGTFLSGAMDIDWPAGSTQPFVLQRGGGIIRVLGGGARSIAHDFESQVAARGEGGALGMALHPKFNDAVAPKKYIYVWYNAEGAPTKQRLSRWTYNTTTNVFDLASQVNLIVQTETVTEHNGAHLRFGPDGYLYFGNGDDQNEAPNTQTLTGGLFSGIFRIDVDCAAGSHAPPRQPTGAVTTGYCIPDSNPFVGVANANEEYFALGFRNPYSFNFDRANGKLWEGDVGASFREEINLIVAGGNYQWPLFEGTRRNSGTGTPTIGTSKNPAFEYPHWQMADLTAIVAGYPYRGAALPELAGKVIHSDWPTGRVWAFDPDTNTRTSLLENNTANAPVGFGQDAAGEVYLVAWSRIMKIVRAPAHTVPLKLSDTHIFRNFTTMKTSSSLVPYSIRSPLWSDGAAKSRWVYLPAGQKATMAADGTVTLPAGSMLVKQFDLPASAQPTGGRTKHLETRVLVVGTDTTYGVTYRWNAAGSDADLVIEGVDEAITDAVTPSESVIWHSPSFGECWSCHRSTNRVIGFRGEQLNFSIDGTNQLTSFVNAGIMDGASIASSPAPIASPADTAASADARASAYLAANCAHCHRPTSSFLGGTSWNALPGIAANSRGIVNVQNHNYPMGAAFGLTTGALVKPGNPAQSILMLRVQSTDRDLGMPPLGRTKVDPLGVSVINSWILSLP